MMNKFVTQEALLNIKSKIKEKIRLMFSLFRILLQKLNKRQCIIILFSLMILLAVFFAAFAVSHSNPRAQLKANHPAQFETIKKPIQKTTLAVPHSPAVVSNPAKDNDVKLQTGINNLEKSSNKQMQAMQVELQIMQSRLTSLASEDDIQKLQQTVSQPNEMLLGKMNSLQSSVQKIVAQTAKKTWVDPDTVQKYFHLVAVQGFSDGMRTIIDVDGNQTALSKNEICPVCRGWVLQKMNFPNQSAVFSKHAANQTLYVKLQSN